MTRAAIQVMTAHSGREIVTPVRSGFCSEAETGKSQLPTTTGRFASVSREATAECHRKGIQAGPFAGSGISPRRTGHDLASCLAPGGHRIAGSDCFGFLQLQQVANGHRTR